MINCFYKSSCNFCLQIEQIFYKKLIISEYLGQFTTSINSQNNSLYTDCQSVAYFRKESVNDYIQLQEAIALIYKDIRGIIVNFMAAVRTVINTLSMFSM